MKKMLLLAVSAALLATVLAPATESRAVPINITISDTVYQTSGTSWYGNREDQEVEPGCIATQVWDLEAFVLDGTTLTLYSGYNISAPPSGGLPGDIFFDVNGDAVYGVDQYSRTSAGNYATISNADYRFDYVIDLRDDGSGYYDVYRLGNDTLFTVFYRQNDESNPWRRASGGAYLGSGRFGVVNMGAADLTVAGTTLTGGTHYATSFDIGFLQTKSFLAKFTMQCGNDNIVGRSQAVPEPGSLLLLGTGLFGLGLLRRRKPVA